MRNTDKTKEQLAQELAALHCRIQELEKSEVEHKQIEEALRQSEEKYRMLFEMSPDGITILDMKGVVTATNPATLEIGGYSEDDIVGKRFSKLAAIRVRDLPKYIKTFTSTMNKGEN